MVLSINRQGDTASGVCVRLYRSHERLYAWQVRQPCLRSQEEEHLLDRIHSSFDASKRTYGSPRVLHVCERRGSRAATTRSSDHA